MLFDDLKFFYIKRILEELCKLQQFELHNYQ